MKCLKATLSYFFDKGAQMVLLSVVPSLLAALLFSPSAGLYMLASYEDIRADSFASLYKQMHFLSYDFYWVGIIGLALCIFAIALLFGIVDRHMRIGEFTLSFRRAKMRINYNILTALRFGLAAGVTFELADVLLTLLYYAWARLFGSGEAWLVLSLFSLIAVTAVFLFVMSGLLLWPPFMLHTGMRSGEAFRLGWRQMSGRLPSSAFTLLLGLLPFAVAMAVVSALTSDPVVRVVLDGVAIAVALPYYITVMYVQFYDVTGTERMDLNKTDIWSRKTARRDKKRLRDTK